MGEIIVQRDEQGRIAALIGEGLEDSTPAARTGMYLLRAAEGTLSEYLRLSPALTATDAVRLIVDRSDPLLNREIDAVMETVVRGLKLLAQDFPDELAVHEATLGVKV
ncbi:hypothetical protein DRJ23_04220 [Candidatus Acetothermia bacterium]|nr:MAG: hypothetical protein DRJ23_04220 [Candidatus Acetothermia bacterium]